MTELATDLGGAQLSWQSAFDHPDLVAPAVSDALGRWSPRPDPVEVAAIDSGLADTAEFCAAYGIPLGASANCVIVSGKRDGAWRFGACLVLATTRADVNGVARRLLDVRKASFAAMAEAVELTGMEYGGITPIGLPADWPVFVSAQVATAPVVVIGSGLRSSKLRVSGAALLTLPGAALVTDLARESQPPVSPGAAD